MGKISDEMRTLCEMLLSASDHCLDRYQSELDVFVRRARELARDVLELDEVSDEKET